ncbi:MAG: hypothetical protein JWP11_2051 [Frankiales bacterium]|nr:hypothetical protein [Frankiales bacterium]
MSLTDRTIDAQRRTYESVAGLVATLSDAQLTEQSGATEWTVAQVLSHLGSGNEIHFDTLRLAREGKERPGDANQPVWDRWNAMSPREQADGFLQHGRALVDALAGMDAAERSSLRVPLSFLPEPATLELYMGLRLNEDALHGWDVAVAYDDKAEIASDTAGVVLEQYRGPIAFLLGYTGKTEVLAGRTAELLVRAPEVTAGLALAEKVAVTDPPANPDGELRLPLGAFLRLMGGRLREIPADAVTGSVTADELRQVFPGY